MTSKLDRMKKDAHKRIVYNAMRTPDGTVLHSESRHDYVTHKDANGNEYMLDGGNDYIRSSAHGDEEYLTLYEDSNHVDIRDVVTWGTYGKGAVHPLKRVPICDLSDEHIAAILETQVHIRGKFMESVMKHEQLFRRN